MIRTGRVLSVSVLLLCASPAWAVTADHLQCFKISDAAAKAQYTADVTPGDLNFPAAAGCTIKVPAKLLCVDAVKSSVTPAPPGSQDPGAQAQQYLCYKTKCPAAQPTATLDDQFGSHAVTVKSTGLLCAPVIAAPACDDGLANGNETDIDCGGGTCPTCALGDQCLAASDCTSGVCTGGVCSAPAATCSDAIQNGNETDVDCGGGTCPTCALGDQCLAGSDCTSGVCTGGLCSVPAGTCSDAIKNGNETGIDCGGGTCPACAPGGGCATAGDCASSVCQFGMCQTPSCSDGVKNGSETGVDCGGGICATCGNGQSCLGGSDCTSGTCSAGVCVP